MALVTGMRMGELLALRWADVGLEAGSIKVQHTVNWYGKGGLIESEPKTVAGRRRVMLPSFAIGVLREHRAYQATMRERVGHLWKENGLVFCNKLGGVIESNNLRATFRQLLKEYVIRK